MSTQPITFNASDIDQPQAQPQAQGQQSTQSQAPITFNVSDIDQAQPSTTPQADPQAGATPEERSFLQTNPNYVYVQRDANFPNRQAGIYHKDEAGAPSFADPQMEHHPVDLHFAKHTAQYGIQSAINVATLPFGPGEELISGLMASLRAMPIAERLAEASNLVKLAEKHPALAALIRGGIRGSTEGSVIGAANAPEGQRLQGATQGAEIGGGLGVLGGALSSIHAVVSPEGVMSPTPLGKQAGLPEPGPLKQVWQAEKVAQPAARTALRTGIQTGSRDAGLATVQPESLRTIAEEPINSLEASAKASYKQIDQAAGTDFKALNDKLDNTEYQIRQLTETEEDLAKEAKLEKSRTAIIQKIADAKAEAIKNGVDPKLLDQADAQFMQARALKDVEAKVFKNPNIVHGNAKFGTFETVDVGEAVKALQKLQDSEKYGSPRLEQALGKQGANNLLKDLYAAQRSGVRAMTKQQWAKTIGKVLVGSGLTYEALNSVLNR